MRSCWVSIAFGLALVVGLKTETSSYAQEVSPNAFAYRAPVSEPERQDARTMRNVGLGLTISGLVTAVAGAATGAGSLTAGLPIDCRGGSCGIYSQLFYASIPLAIVSSVMLSVGPALWATGARRMRSFDRRLGIAVAPSPKGGSAGLLLRF